MNKELKLQVLSCSRLWQKKLRDYERRRESREQALELKVGFPSQIYPQVVLFWDPWEAEWNCDIEERVGTPPWSDGPKFVCNPRRTLNDRHCLVYSFGSNGEIEFEKGVKAVNPNCEVHVFDHTDDAATSAVVAEVGTFHSVGLGDKDESLKAGTVKPLVQIMKELGHTGHALTLLKVDIEGAEWNSFANHIWEQCKTGQLKINQLQVELHASQGVTSDDVNTFFHNAESCGLMIFHKERNGWGCYGHLCVEYALVHKDTALEAFVDSHCPWVAHHVFAAIREHRLHCTDC